MQLLDATLREGEQRSGQSFSVDQKVAGARVLDELGVDYIEVGFPIARDGTDEVCARLDTDAKVEGMARALERDVDAAVSAGVDVVGIGVPGSDLQREEIMGASREEVIRAAVDIYEYAEAGGVEVHLSAMDSFRADPAFLQELIEAVDAPVFALLDTVGIATPLDVATLLEGLDVDPERLGVHFHQDLGMAAANVLAAAQYDVGKADVTVGGIGDRAGNAPLEEVVVAGTVGPHEVDFGVDEAALIPRCRELLDLLGEEIPPHQPILGRTAFEHESGMHTATMLDTPSAYEPFDPARFGGERRLLFGPSSGRGAARRLLVRAGADDPDDDAVAGFLDRLHDLDEHVELDVALEMAAEDAG